MFSKSMIPDSIVVPVTYPALYKDSSGKPITFHFKFRLETEGDQDAIQRLSATGASSTETNLERLALLLVEAPPECGDFPQNGDLKASVREYFKGEKEAHLVRGALQLYNTAVSPAELFRSL